MLRLGMKPAMRSYVCCNSVRPVEKKSRNCFGQSSRLHGHSLRPFPPARIKQKLFVFSLISFTDLVNGVTIFRVQFDL